MLPCKLQTWLVGIALHGARSLAPCHGLSGGERLKLGVLMVLAQLPDLLLLDEPDNHLDHASRPATHPGAGRLSEHPAAGLPRSRLCGRGGIELVYWLVG